MLFKPKMITGNMPMPNFYTGGISATGHVGDGAIRITELYAKTCKSRQRTISVFITIIIYESQL